MKQYQKMFEIEKVKLTFTKESLRAIAREAMRRNSGARGLRAIMEDAMLDIMYDVPYREGVQGVPDHRGGGHQARAAAAGAGEGKEDRLGQGVRGGSTSKSCPRTVPTCTSGPSGLQPVRSPGGWVPSTRSRIRCSPGPIQRSRTST